MRKKKGLNRFALHKASHAKKRHGKVFNWRAAK